MTEIILTLIIYRRKIGMQADLGFYQEVATYLKESD